MWRMLLVCGLLAWTTLAGSEAWKLVEEIEDLRLLWSATAYQVHELDTLLQYAAAFGATEADPREAREWHERMLHLFEPIKSLDDGGQALIAWLDYTDHTGDVEADLAHLRHLRGACAAETLALHRELAARLVALRSLVARLAAERGMEAPVIREPMPWADPIREKGRQMGFNMSWFVWMNHAETSRHAALTRQQRRGVDDLLAAAAKLGVRSIVPEFHDQENLESCSWRVCEEVPGVYDFSRLDANLAQIAGYGMQAVVPIRSLTTTAPAWALERFGDEARLWRWDDKQGKAVPTDGVNLLHEATATAFEAYLERLVEHLRTQHGDQVALISLEMHAAKLAPTLDYSPAAQAHFRAWLADRYGTIGELNRRWDSGFGEFAEVVLPPPAGNAPAAGEPAGRWQDWIAWRKAYITAIFERQVAVIQRVWPEIPVQAYAIESNSHHAHSERPLATWPLHWISEAVDLPGSHATVEPVQVLLRSTGGGRFLSQQAEQNFGSMLGGAAYSGLFKDVMYSVARNGAEKILRYFYSPGLYGYMDRAIDWDGVYSYRLKVQEMNRLSSLVGNTRPSPTPLAVLWSEQSYDLDATVYSRYGALGMAYALMSAKVHYDMVTEASIAEGALDGYEWLVIPEQRWLSDGTLAAVRAFVERGGTLFATSIPGWFDAQGEQRGHALADLFGADLESFTPIQAIPGTYLVPTRPTATWDHRERGASWRRHNQFHPEDWRLGNLLCATLAPRDGAEALLHFADGRAALVANRHGEGRTFLLGYPFGHEYAYSNTTEMSFGKLYPHYSYPPQMTELGRWLGDFVRGELAYSQVVQVPQSRLARAQGREGRAPAMTFPSFGDDYSSRLVELDEPNHSVTIGLRGREGVETTYLTVWNRDSAYAVGRGYAHFMAAPTHAVIRINRPDITAIYDVINRCHVPVTKGDISRRAPGTGEPADQDRCVSFLATIPAYFGRVYAFVSDGAPIELFAEDAVPGITDAQLVARVEALASPWSPPEVLVWDAARLTAWWNAQAREGERVIAYGSLAYREAAEALAAGIRAAGGTATISALGMVHETSDADPYLRHRGARYLRQLDRIDVLIGNDWSNTNLADLTGAWQASRHANPILPVSVNLAFPGEGRAVLMTTHPFHVRDGNRNRPMPGAFHHFREAPSMLVIGASSPGGAVAGVRRLLNLIEAGE